MTWELRPGVRISGMVCSNPPQYVLAANPFDFLTDFDRWFWYEVETKLKKRHWFTIAEIETRESK